MANRALLPETFMAVGSLILGIPYLVKNEETFTNITTAQLTDLSNSSDVHGSHNIASQVANGANWDVVLHQIRMYNASDVGLRPSWASVTTQETNIQNDNTLANSKRTTIYNNYRALVNSFLNLTLDSLTNPQITALEQFQEYMRGNGIIINGKGRIIGFQPSSKALIEYHYKVSIDNNDWLVCTLNSQWADFVA